MDEGENETEVPAIAGVGEDEEELEYNVFFEEPFENEGEDVAQETETGASQTLLPANLGAGSEEEIPKEIERVKFAEEVSLYPPTRTQSYDQGEASRQGEEEMMSDQEVVDEEEEDVHLTGEDILEDLIDETYVEETTEKEEEYEEEYEGYEGEAYYVKQEPIQLDQMSYRQKRSHQDHVVFSISDTHSYLELHKPSEHHHHYHHHKHMDNEVPHDELHEAMASGEMPFGMIDRRGGSEDDDSQFDALETAVRDLLPGFYDDGFDEEDVGERDETVLGSEGSSEGNNVLEVDNPMMERFQKIYKDHLLRQIDRLEENLQHISVEKKKMNEESKLVADSIYRDERFITKQANDIDCYRSSIEEMQKKRESLEKTSEETKQQHRAATQVFKRTQNDERDLLKERDFLNELYFKFKEYESQKDQGLKTSKAVSDNLEIEKRRLADEKMKQDLLIWKMEKEIMRLSKALDTSLDNCKALQEETQCLDNVNKNLENNIENLEKEIKALGESSRQIYTAIKAKDEAKPMAENKLSLSASNLKTILNNLSSYGKSFEKELILNEELTNQNRRIVEQLEHTRNKLQRLNEQKTGLEREYVYMSKVLDLVNDALDKTTKNSEQLKKEKEKAREEVNLKKIEYEDLKKEYLTKILETGSTEKVTHSVEDQIKKLGLYSKQLEDRIIESEAQLAKALLQTEMAKSKLQQMTERLNAVQNDERRLNQELKFVQHSKKWTRDKINALTAQIKLKERKISFMRVEEEAENEKNMTSAERKLMKLEKAMNESQALTKKLTTTWFTLQEFVMKKKDDRAKQVHDVNFKRKHNISVESCKIRSERTLQTVDYDISKVVREINKEQRAIDRWQENSVKTKTSKERLEISNKELEEKLILSLQDAEIESKDLENELTVLRTRIEEITDEASQLQEQLLEKEKKWKMAVEAKDRIDKERRAGGEVDAMRLEIHRMEVRFIQLKKVQEKMMSDLEMCVSRRDRIMDVADAREMRSRITGKQFSREQAQRKINELKNKISQTNRKYKEVNRNLESTATILGDLRAEYAQLKNSTDSMKISVDELERQIQEGQLHKHACLETAVLRQKKTKLVQDARLGRYRFSYKTADSLEAEQRKQQSLTDSLTVILENLAADFPRLALQISQILNSVRPLTESFVQPDKSDDPGDDVRSDL